jgi:hypothetical protein
MDANKLAQEIGAEQFAMMMVDNPNIFNTIEPSLRQKLLDGSRKVLTMFGAVDPYTGNPLDISISPILKRNKQVRNLYKNYIKQREKSIVDKVDLAEKGVAIKVRKGESADQAVERMFGAQGISLKDAGAFRINNRKIREKLSQILNRLDEQPEGPMSSERNPRSGKPQSIVGKELSSELRNVFTRNDPRGTINVLINDITESIKNRIQLNFLYRSGKPSKYSDNELRARVVSPVRFKVTGILAKGPKSAASLKMDAIDEAYLRNNVEVLVKEKFTDKPDDLIEQAREVARQAMDDPEGRINPEGNFENELITAVFGMEQSAPQIRNARLRQLLEDKKLQHAYRSYDVDALAGIAPTGKSGIAFDYFNIKNNYSPFDDKLFIPAYHGTPHTLAPEAGAPLGRFRTSKIGTGEGAQAYGHGLYFAGKKQVADYYRKGLSEKLYDGKSYDEINPKHHAAKILDDSWDRGSETKEYAREMVIETYKEEVSWAKSKGEDASKMEAIVKVLEEKSESKIKDGGSLYKVELAPKENEYLLWDKPLSEQPKGVREKVKNLLLKTEDESGFDFTYGRPSDRVETGEEVYRGLAGLNRSNNPNATTSAALKEAGIPGIKYLDGSSRSKGEGDYNYVIFDEADVQITDKLFMPASEAGAGKGKQAEAAKLWNEKGTESPYFKKWFGKSKVVDENGEPLVVYHGTPGKLEGNFFDPNRLGSSTGAKDAKKGFYFSDSPLTAEAYMGENYKYTPQEGQRLEQLTKRNEALQSELENIRSTYSSPSDAVLASRKLRNEYSQNLAEMRSIDDNVKTQKSGTSLDVYLSMKDPLTFDFKRNGYDEATTSRIISEALNNGNDGVIFKNMMDDPEGGRVSDIYVAFSPEQIKSATGNRGTFDAGERNILFMPASEAADLDFKISTRNPTAKNATENPITEDLIINTASIADDATMLESHALALQEYPGIKKNSKVPKRIIDRFVDHVVDNLLYLHDQVRPEVRNRSKLWYDGARNITEKWNQQYGNDKQSIAAALASLSPQKDWFMNVDLARRMLDIYKDQSGFAFDKAMAKKYIQLFEKGIGKKKATEIAEAMVGKTLNELQSDFEQAAFIRSYDEVYNPREYQIVSPEGDFIGLAKSLDGVNKKVAWGSMTEISKAVKVLRNPSKESISTALGNAHKIRNFYNNILLPNADEFSVTIDTHAIAAALLRPLAGADLEVANNFGSKPKGAKRSIKNSSVKGISGTYGIYADAYRKAAEARGILPREMQSITWEAVRGLYEAKWKTKSNKAKIDNLWKKYENGELTLNETREQILEAADGIREPEWVTERSDSGTDGGNESSNKSEELYRSELGGSELRANPRGGRTNPRGSKEVNFLPAGNFSRQPANRIQQQAPAMPGNRFMAPAASAGAKLSERFR